MATIILATWISNAAAVLTGAWGDVSRRAQAVGQSRQALYQQARKVLLAVARDHDRRRPPTAEQDPLQALRDENQQLEDWLQQTIDFPPPRQQQFLVTAAAMGLSLSQTHELLSIVLGSQATPSRATLGRLVQTAGQAAGPLLRRLDQTCRSLIVVGCLDEIFCGQRPVLMGIEPVSQVWFLGQFAPDRRGTTWQAALHDWSALEFVIADAGSGLQAGIAAEQQDRQQRQQPPLRHALDLFHTTHEGTRVLNHRFRSLEKLWHQAEKADRDVEAARRQGRRTQRVVLLARNAWRAVTTAFTVYEAQEAAWRAIRQGLSLWRDQGQLNDRQAAEAAIAAALPVLTGRAWAKVRRYLHDPASLAVLDRTPEQLERAEPEAALRQALVRLWWLRHEAPGRPMALAVVQRVVGQGLRADWPASYLRVARVLRQAVRASSAVEGLNSVLRMHQARHRRMSQNLLDLKRLYWNLHRFREGRRRHQSPYELLGVLPKETTFWSMLQQEQAQAA